MEEVIQDVMGINPQALNRWRSAKGVLRGLHFQPSPTSKASWCA
jgi:dTDP-4-dehydrorhamnose 3,5-epimerase-like enzyme